MANLLERPILHHHNIPQSFNFQDCGHLLFLIFKTEIFNSCALLERGLLEIDHTIASTSWIFRVFQVKCKNSLDNHAQY